MNTRQFSSMAALGLYILFVDIHVKCASEEPPSQIMLATCIFLHGVSTKSQATRI